MATSLITGLVILCLILIARGLAAPGRAYAYPFLAGGIFLTFVAPQLPGLVGDPAISQPALAKTVAFTIACLAMIWVGWSLGTRRLAPDASPPALPAYDGLLFDERRLLQCAAALSLCGAWFFYAFGQLPDTERLRGIHTGTAVVYLFFAKLLTYGFAIAVLVYASRPSRAALAVIAFDTVFYLERILIAGKRGETAEFVLIIALALWFQRRKAAPRPAIVAALLLSLVGMLGAEQYRQATLYSQEPNWSLVREIDLVRNMERMLAEGGPEMTNAVLVVDRVDARRDLDFGLVAWNWIVHAYVPAQVVGGATKAALKFELPALFDPGYQPPVGSTSTGMADAFASFWYFGCLIFGLVSWFMARLYVGAMQGSVLFQLGYMLSAVPSMLVITHFTAEMVIAWIHIVAFVAPALLYAHVHRNRVLLHSHDAWANLIQERRDS